jgi:hypothetical protein
MSEQTVVQVELSMGTYQHLETEANLRHMTIDELIQFLFKKAAPFL